MKLSLPLITLLLGLAISGASAGEETAAAPLTAVLTDAEADRLVREEWIERDLSAQVQVERLDQVPAVQRYVVDLGGRQVLFNRVSMPARRASEAFADEAAVPNSGGEQTDGEFAGPPKPHHTLFVSGVAGNDGLVALQWSIAGREYQGVSGLDLHVLPPFVTIGTDQASYTFALLLQPPGAGAEASFGEHETQVRSLLDQEGVGYVQLQEEPDLGEHPALHGMDALHGFFVANEGRLRREQQNRLALEAARQRLREATPSDTRPTVINFTPRTR